MHVQLKGYLEHKNMKNISLPMSTLHFGTVVRVMLALDRDVWVCLGIFSFPCIFGVLFWCQVGFWYVGMQEIWNLRCVIMLCIMFLYDLSVSCGMELRGTKYHCM